MRKTSQDGGDTTSITSGIENEIKKPGAILKTKRNSIKRKVQNFSHESDETVIEPLLQKDKEKTDTLNQSAKYNLLSKTKTDSNSDRGSEKDKLIQDDKLSTANVSNVKDSTISTSMKDATALKFTTTGPLHNHMNTNMFSSHDAGKGFVAPKTQILVEIDGSKQGSYSPSPLIFTTAKIHTDGKTMHMEPVQVTPAPILSTIEVSVLKSGSTKGETSGIVNSNISAVYSTTPKSNIIVTEKDQKTSFKTVDSTPTPSYIVGTKVLISGDKTTVTSNEQTKNSISSLATKDPTTNQINLNSNNLIKDSLMGSKSIGENVHQTKVTPQALKSTIIDETKPSNVTCEPTKLVGIVSTKTHFVNDPSKSDGKVNQAAAKIKTDDCRNLEKKTESINNPTAIGSVKAHKSDNLYLAKLTTPQTLNSTVSDKTKKSVVTCEPNKLVGPVNTKVHTVNDSCKSDRNDNKALTAANTKSDENPEKKTESSYNPSVFDFVKPNKSDVKKNTDKTTLNSTTATNSRQLQRQNIVIDTENPNLKLEPHINPSATKNTNVSSEKSQESQKTSSTAKNATPIKSSGNDSFSSSDGTTLPKQSANNVPVRSVPISTAASVNKTAALKYTPALVHKSSLSDTTSTIATDKTSASIANTVPTKNPPTSANNSQVQAVSKLPSSIANSTSVKKSPVNTTTTVDDYKSSSPINAAVSVNKTKTTDVTKKVPTSIPTSSVKADNTSSTGTTSLNQINSKSTVFTTSKTHPSATTKNKAADAIILSSTITSGTTNLKSTNKAPVTSTVIAKSTASTSITPSKTLTNTAVQPNAASAIKSPTGIKSPIAATSKSLTQPKTVSKLDNAKESLSGSGKSSTSKINNTVAPGITNVTSNVSTTTTAINSTDSSSKAAASNKKSDAKSNELSNGSQIFKGQQ